MRLKTSHNTYVFAGQAGQLLHGPAPAALHGQALRHAALGPAAAGREFALEKGPLAPSTLVVLEGGWVAFRRDGLYLCADPGRPELAFNRPEVGPWEQFAIGGMEGGAMERRAPGVLLRHIAKSFIPPLSGTAIDFRRRARAKFAVTGEETTQPPITISQEHAIAFQQGVQADFPNGLHSRYVSKCSINKLPSKYLIMSDLACGIIFDQDRFWTDPVSLRAEKLPAYIFRDGENHRLDFSYLKKLPEEDVSTLVFYDSNHSNYFHWWAECMANIELAALCLGSVPPMIIWNGRPALNDWQRASLDILGVDVIHRTTQSSRVVRVKEAVWFYRESGSAPGFLLRGLRTRVLKTVATTNPVGRKLYIKRRVHRRVINDECVEMFLSNIGYEIICAEDLSQSAQIELFSTAQVVIAIHGAGLTNMLFMPPGAAVIELMPNVEVRSFYWIMTQKLHHRYGVLMCPAVDGRFDGCIHVDLSELRRLISRMERDAQPTSGDMR